MKTTRNLILVLTLAGGLDGFAQFVPEVPNAPGSVVPARGIQGIVRDASGKPAPDVIISFQPTFPPVQDPGRSDLAETKTGLDGRYVLHFHQSPNEVYDWEGPVEDKMCVLARDAKSNLFAVAVFTNMPSNLDLTLQPALALYGTVKDANGAPLNYATAQFLGLFTSTFVEFRSTNMDAQGCFSFPAILPGASLYQLEVSAQGYGRLRTRLTQDGQLSNFFGLHDFVLKRADRHLSGRVLLPDGHPAIGALMIFSGEGQPEFGGIGNQPPTDDQGRFALGHVCEGSIDVRAILPAGNFHRTDLVGIASGQGGQTNLLIQLGQSNGVPITGPGGLTR